MMENMKKDAMSDFYVRDELIPFLQRAIYEAKQNNKKFTVVVFDLDNFKKINDRYGHLYGDKVLKSVFSTLKLSLKGQAYPFRYGGDEIVVIFLDKTSKDVFPLVKQCQRMLSAHPIIIERKSLKMRISCGIADYGPDGETIDGLIKAADDAVYLSKAYGGNLITRAGRLGYIKIRNFILFMCAVLMLWSGVFLSNQFLFKDFIRVAVDQIKNIRFIIKAQDTIVLTDGSTIKGKVLDNSGSKVLISLDLIKGDAKFTLNKSEIIEIKYAPSSRFNK